MHLFHRERSSPDATASDSARSSFAGRVVVVDDDAVALRMLARLLDRAGFEVLSYGSAPAALAAVAASGGSVEAIVSDRQMPGMDGIAMLSQVRDRWPDLPFIVLTGNASPESAIDAMRQGAYDYLSKPFDRPGEIAHVVARAVERRRLAGRNRALELTAGLAARFSEIVGQSPPMLAVFQKVEAIAATDATVLLLGESGTGKELVARAIAERGGRKDRPFVAINCAALPDSLLESELFGHVRGAFTGATASRPGLFEEASGGTVFLDEIGDISPAMQVRLLRVLQEGEIRPLGTSEVRRVDVRVIAATHRDLVGAIEGGSFREDLYYRLNVFSIHLPALRDRTDDIPLIVHHLAEKYAGRYGRAARKIDPAAAMLLLGHRWPGNVRELENVIQRAVLLAPGDTITAAAIRDAMPATPGRLPAAPAPVAAAVPSGGGGAARRSFAAARGEALAAFASAYLDDTLRQCGGSVVEAARVAEVETSNFRRLLRRHRIDATRFRGASPFTAPGHGDGGHAE